MRHFLTETVEHVNERQVVDRSEQQYRPKWQQQYRPKWQAVKVYKSNRKF